jgi:ADP-ribose pyrophosphatase YjhB (NUDIX family)/ribosomal protein S27AE
MKHQHHGSGSVEANHQIQHEFPRNVRFCPMCGGALEMRIVAPDHKENKVCIKCGFVYFLGPKLVAGCIIADGYRTLLLRRGLEPSLGKWTYPGGFVDLGETPENCALRETVEEVGMTVQDPELLGIYADRNDPKPIIVVTYLAKPGAETPIVTPEATEVRYFGVDEIPWDGLAFDTTVQAMEAWAKALRKGR